MWSEDDGDARSRDLGEREGGKCEPEPHLFHGDEEYDECAEQEMRPPDEVPPTGEELTEEPGHIPSQEEWLGTTSSEEESLERAAEEETGAPPESPRRG